MLRGDAGANNQAVNQRYENVFCYSFAVVFFNISMTVQT